MKKEGILELCKTDKDASNASSLMVEVLKEFASYKNAFGSDLEDLLAYYRPEIRKYLWICKVENEIIGTITLDEKLLFVPKSDGFLSLPLIEGKDMENSFFKTV